LPASVTSFVGRAAEVAELARLLAEDRVRLVTTTGAGGIGKTRLAIEAARAVADRFTDGVRLAPLASLSDADLVPSAIAQAIGLPALQGQPLDVVARLRDMELLLLLDNFEHLLPAAGLMGRVLAECPGVSMLVTSRALLGLQGERAFRVPTLTVTAPNTSSHASTSDAVSLFEERAREVVPTFHLSEENQQVVAEICRRLDGLPLAIELVVPRLKLLGPEALLARLDDDLSLLTSSGADRPERHRTIEAAIKWSHDLLDADTQALFRRLCVFVGGFDLDAAEAVYAGGDGILDGVASLLDQSLLVGDSDGRLSVLETVRHYGLARLDDAGDAGEVRARHARFFRELAASRAPALASARRTGPLQQLSREADNLRTAIEFYVNGGRAEAALELATDLGWFFYHDGRFEEGRRLLGDALSMPENAGASGLRARALTAAARLAYYQADFEHTRVCSDEAIRILRETGNVTDLAYALYVRALAAQGVNSPDAVGFATDAVSHMRTTDDRWGLALVVFYLGAVTIFLGPEELVVPALTESERIFRELGDVWGLSGALFYRGMLHRRHGELAEAQQLLSESVELFRDSGDLWRLNVGLAFLAEVTDELGGDPMPFRTEEAAVRRQMGLPGPG
jgi:predicted ATPase